MQTLYFDVAECPTGSLSKQERHILDGDSGIGNLFGATLISETGVPVIGDDGETVVGYNFSAGHADANCQANFSNAIAIFEKAAADLGDGSSADEDVVCSIVKKFMKPRMFSIMYIEFSLAEIGVDMSSFWGWLETIQIKPGITAKRAWDRANVLSDGFEGFNTYLSLAKQRLGLSDATAERILERCVSVQ